jgi:hypothetical protein
MMNHYHKTLISLNRLEVQILKLVQRVADLRAENRSLRDKLAWYESGEFHAAQYDHARALEDFD